MVQSKTIWRHMLATVVLLGATHLQAAELPAADVMAAYLRHIAALTTWPADAEAGGPVGDDTVTDVDPILIGVVGDDPNGVMRKMRARVASAEGLLAQDRPIGILDLRFPADGGDMEVLESCALLFLSEGAGDDWQRIRSAVNELPIVTVSEMQNFAERGGMIEYFIDRRNKVRLKVNLVVMREAGITLSARMLSLDSVIVLDEEDG